MGTTYSIGEEDVDVELGVYSMVLRCQKEIGCLVFYHFSERLFFCVYVEMIWFIDWKCWDGQFTNEIGCG